MRPTLKQFADLRDTDFDEAPVWASCHSLDYEEPWYDETDEETFRPWSGPLPVDPSAGIYLVKASFRLADGRRFCGFATPVPPNDADNLGFIQPYIYVAGTLHGFWGGMIGVAPEARTAFYSAIEGDPDSVFPIEFELPSGLAVSGLSGEVDGFYSSPDLQNVVVER